MKTLSGLLGESLKHSYSPQIHSSLFAKTNMEAYYHLFEVDKKDLAQVVNSMKILKIKGLNVTIPYKVEVIQYLDDISKEAEAIGAVNTIVIEDGKTIGYNTDYFGFGHMLNKFNIKVDKKSAVLLGAGGATKAVYHYLLNHGAKEIIIVSRNKNKNEEYYKNVQIVDYEGLKELKDRDIVINCTPVGMYPKIDESPIEKELLKNFKIAVDLIYNPEKTKFLLEAENLGLKAVNGLYMLVSQAIKAEELWNSIIIDEKIVDNIYLEVKESLYGKRS
jgi:shikimate dehydrogenase